MSVVSIEILIHTFVGSVAPAASPSGPGLAEVKQIEEFNVWTKPDCCGTPYANGNRSVGYELLVCIFA